MKRVSKTIALFISICMILAFMPSIVNAVVTDTDSEDSKIIRKTTTNYFTTIVFNGTLVNEENGVTVSFSKTSSEIAGNIDSEAVLAEVKSIGDEFTTWAEGKGATSVTIPDGGITDYYYDAHDEITQENVGNNSDVIFVGDIEDLDHAYVNQGQVTINTILDKHQTLTINATANVEENSEYKIIDGANQTYKVNKDSNITVKADGELNKFIELRVDKKDVSSENYEVSSGSTIATLKTAYLDTLSAGKHTLTFVYTDGEVSTEFTVVKTNNPPTGDNVLLYIALFTISMLSFIVIAKKELK